MTGIVVDEVGVHPIILHAHQVAVPSPSEGDTRVADVVDGVVLDGDATDIAGTDGHTAPVFVGDILEQRLLHRLRRTHLAEVGGLIGQVGLQSGGRERAAHVTVHGDIAERATADAATLAAGDIIEPRSAEMTEGASFETDILTPADFNSGIGTSQPSLVVELVVVRTVYLRTKLVGLRQIHTCLKGHMTLHRRTHPCGVRERHTFYIYITHGALSRSDAFHQCLHNRDNSLLRLRPFVLAGHIIEFVLTNVVIPLTRLVEQYLRIGEVEG